MPLSTGNEFLRYLNNRKRQCLEEIIAAESRGDLKLARLFHLEITQINAMIQKRGGQIDT